jgi:hypothetical protein
LRLGVKQYRKSKKQKHNISATLNSSDLYHLLICLAFDPQNSYFRFVQDVFWSSRQVVVVIRSLTRYLRTTAPSADKLVVSETPDPNNFR